MLSERLVSTPQGEARLVTRRAKRPVAALLLSHGAGGGIDAPDLLAIAKLLPGHGISTHLLEQPWRVAGRKVAPRPEALDQGLVAVCSTLRMRVPLVVGGRSAGARSAARQARALAAVGCLALAFPLHPPGKPERSRIGELEGARVRTLVIQGERDPFGRPEEFPPETRLVVVPEADHSFRVPKRAELQPPATYHLVATTARDWVRGLVEVA